MRSGPRTDPSPASGPPAPGSPGPSPAEVAWHGLGVGRPGFLLYVLFMWGSKGLLAWAGGPAVDTVIQGWIVFCLIVAFTLLLGAVAMLARRGASRHATLMALGLVLFTLEHLRTSFTSRDIALLLQSTLLGYLLFRGKPRDGYTLRMYLYALVVTSVVLFLDTTLQGLLPRYAYRGHEIQRGIYLAWVGMLMARARNVDAPLRLHLRLRPRRTYDGRRPLVDLHLYPLDLLIVLVALLTGAFYQNLEQASPPAIPRGAWVSNDARMRLELDGEGKGLLQRGEEDLPLYYAVKGNPLDGYRLRVHPVAGRPADHPSWRPIPFPDGFRIIAREPRIVLEAGGKRFDPSPAD